MKPCTTHHHACACREQAIADLIRIIRDGKAKNELVASDGGRFVWRVELLFDSKPWNEFQRLVNLMG